MKQCRHDNIVQYYGSTVKGKVLWVRASEQACWRIWAKVGPVQILMEFCGGGAVNDLMNLMPNKTFTEQQIAAIIAESLKGLVRPSP